MSWFYWRTVAAVRWAALWVALLPGAAGQDVAAARKLLEQGEPARAVQLLENVIRANPRDGQARLLLGTVLNEDGRHEQAVEQLTEAVRLLPNSAQAHNALGEAYADLDAVAAARGEFEKAVEIDGNLPVARINLGMVLAQQSELVEAKKQLDRALTLAPAGLEAARAHYLLAKVYTQQDQIESAAAELKQAVRIEPDFAEAWSDLGQARKGLSDDAGALAAFRRAVALSPSDAVAQTRLGVELLRGGRIKEAYVHLRQAYR